MRPPPKRTASSTTDRSDSPAVQGKPVGAAALRAMKSPVEPSSVVSKRKERDLEREINEDTSIHVVVRCRGRSEREVQDNSAVAVSAEGVKGKSVDLSMGPNAVSNKTYTFDKVFSPAADQTIVYEDVVLPIVNEVRDVELLKDGEAVLTKKKIRCLRATIARYSRTVKQAPERRIRCLAI